MPYTFDLEHYFARIGYRGPRAATLDVLSELHALHPRAIAFENLDPLLGRRVAVEPPSIAAKLLQAGRGGYCFEQNRLFAGVLTQLGFAVTPLFARVIWGRASDAVTPRTHMLLRVDIDEQAWIADVGFGAVTLTQPLRLSSGTPQPTHLETFRLSDAPGGAFDLEVQSDHAWVKVYRFELQRAEWVDYEVANWYTTAAPESLFVSNLLACLVLPQGRLALFNTRLTERGKLGESLSEREIGSANELANCLSERFLLNLDGIDIAAVFERVRNTPPQ